MYLKQKVISFFKVKNAVFFTVGLVSITESIYVILSLVNTYIDNLNIVLHAVAFPQCIVLILIGIAMLASSLISRKFIEDAYFYSSYFELDLKGKVTFEELAAVTGKTPNYIKIKMPIFRLLYMKSFEIKTIDGKAQIVLEDKICKCQCRYCGALIDKSVYFEGECAYCGSADVFARIISQNRFYSISSEFNEKRSKPTDYQKKSLESVSNVFFALMTVLLGMVFIFLMMIVDSVEKYNDEEYLIKELFAGGGSYKLIREGLVDFGIAAVMFALPCLIGAVLMFKRRNSTKVAMKCSGILARSKKPFVEIKNMMNVLHTDNQGKIVRKMQGSLRQGYLKNCTFEVHDSILKVALHKTITKDKCPTCNGSIVGVVDESYQCRYCGNVIMDVMKKKVVSSEN